MLVNRPNPAVTIEQAAEQHLAYLETRDKAEATLESYRLCYKQLVSWGQSTGVTALNQLTVSALERFGKTLRDHGVAVPPADKEAAAPRGVHANMPKTILTKMKAVRSLIKWALKRPQMLTVDPSAGYDLPPGASKEVQVFTPEELEAILQDPDPEARAMWYFFLHTGMRSAEYCWLLKEDVSRDPWSVWIHRKVCPQTGRVWKPKHGLERVVPLTDPETIEIVQGALDTSPGPWLFWATDTLTSRKGQWQCPRLRRKLAKRLRAVGIEHGTLHGFRHTFCTFLANRPEVQLPHVQKVMGHRSILTTMQYVHIQPGDAARSLAAVDFREMLPPKGEQGESSQLSGNQKDGLVD